MSETQIRRDLSPLFLRLVLGYGFLFHGFGKLFTAGGHAGFAGLLSGLGVPFPDLTAWLVGGTEFAGGAALIAGVLLPIVTPLLTIVMLVAISTVHLQAGFNFMNITGMTAAGPQFGLPGFEVNLLYIAGLLSLLFSGPGAISASALLRRESRAEPTRPAGQPIPVRVRGGR